MVDLFSRTELIIGKENIEKLKKSKIAVFGIGGVGSYTLEGLVRAGIGKLVLVDFDLVDITNINRQIIATTETVGKLKVEVAKERALEINPNAEVEIYKNDENVKLNDVDYIVDCVDTFSTKIDLVLKANELNIPIISCMGTGNKLDPTKFEITDIYKTSVCPLARNIRQELKKRGIKKLKVLYSKEKPIENETQLLKNGKKVLGSISFVPSVAGLIIAGEVVKDIIYGKI